MRRLWQNDRHNQRRLSKKRKKQRDKKSSGMDTWIGNPTRDITANGVYDEILHRYLPGVFAKRASIPYPGPARHVINKFDNKEWKAQQEAERKADAEEKRRSRPEKAKLRTPAVLLALRSTNRLEDLDNVRLHPRTRNHRYPRMVCRKLCRREHRLLAILEAKAAVHVQPSKAVRSFQQSTLIVQPGEKREQARRRRQMERVSLKRELAGRVVAAPSE